MLFRDDDRFGGTLQATAERRDVGVEIVEKDYWVTEALRVLADKFRDDFVFILPGPESDEREIIFPVFLDLPVPGDFDREAFLDVNEFLHDLRPGDGAGHYRRRNYN